MKVAKNTVVSIAYQVRTQDGVLVDEAPANQPLEYLQGHNNLIIGLENALEGKEVGDKFEVRVQPEEGYGEYNENMVQRVPKEVFQGVDEVVVGMRFLADTDIGPVPVVITEVDGDEVVHTIITTTIMMKTATVVVAAVTVITTMITIMDTAVAVAVAIITIMITDTVMAAVVVAVTNLHLRDKKSAVKNNRTFSLSKLSL